MIMTVRERIDAVGEIIMALDEEDLRQKIRNLVGSRSAGVRRRAW